MSNIKRLLEEVREREEADLIENMYDYFQNGTYADEQYADDDEYSEAFIDAYMDMEEVV
jgi:hypothetical protein